MLSACILDIRNTSGHQFLCQIGCTWPSAQLTRNVAAVQDVKPKEEFIMVIDADSVLRMPFYPEHFNVTRGASSPCAHNAQPTYAL